MRKPEYTHGDIVYLKTDPQQLARMVTGYLVRPEHIVYYLTHETEETTHYAIEISKEKDVLKTFGV